MPPPPLAPFSVGRPRNPRPQGRSLLPTRLEEARGGGHEERAAAGVLGRSSRGRLQPSLPPGGHEELKRLEQN
uniref:Uncharacterized protein n=1 Tax=Triticum urartu TaxID=4572 RepID=A0A8R7Q5P8_TRIUA